MKRFLFVLMTVLSGGLPLLAQAPYAFNAADFRIADGGRATQIVVNGDNSFTVTANDGNNNVCFGLKLEKSGSYSVSRDEHWYVVRGSGLNIHARDYSYVWFMNGHNYPALRPVHVLEKDGEQILAWDISEALADGVNELGNNASAFLDCVGLTSSRVDHTATITLVDYMTDAEVNTIFGTDMTSSIVNPSFETGTITPWVLSRNTAWNGINNRNGEADWATDGNKIFGVWDGTSYDVNISQSVTLPAGNYTLMVDMLASNENRIGKQCVFAGENRGYFRYATPEVGCIDNNSEVYTGDNVRFQTIKVDFESDGETATELGVATFAGFSEQTWFKIDNFRLYYHGGASSSIIGAASIDKTVVQPGQTVTVSYMSALSISGDALSLKDGGILLGSNSIEPMFAGNSFTFTVPDLAPGADYTLFIPDNALGFVNDAVFNDEQSITLHTPALYDGTYYMKNDAPANSDVCFMGRGYSWGTRAILSEYGIPVRFQTDEQGTSVVFPDNNRQFANDGGWLYTDYDGGHSRFNVIKSGDSYMLQDRDNDLYVATYPDGGYDCVVHDAEEARASAKWTVLSVEDYLDYVAQHDDAKSVAQAISASYSPTNKADINVQLMSNSLPNNVFLLNNDFYKESYQEYQTTIVEETVESCKAGFYRFSIKAFERATWADLVGAGGKFRGDAYIEVNGVKINIKGLLEDGSDVMLPGANSEFNGKFYANNEEAAKAAFAQGKYLNEIYFNLESDGNITYKVVIPSRYGNDGNRARWIVVAEPVLTYYNPVVSLDQIDLGNTNAEDAPLSEPGRITIIEGIPDRATNPVGIYQGETYRDVTLGGSVEFTLNNSESTAHDISLVLRMNVADAGRQCDIYVNNKKVQSYTVSAVGVDADANGFFWLEIPLYEDAYEANGDAKGTFDVRVVPTTYYSPGMYWVRLIKDGFTIGRTHYVWKSDDYKKGPDAHVTEPLVFAADNKSFEITGKGGEADVSFELDNIDDYYIDSNECWYVVKGQGLDVSAAEKSQLWFVNGGNTGYLYPEIYLEKDGEQIVAWNLKNYSNLLRSFGGKVPLTKYGSEEFCTLCGLTSTRVDGSAIITLIDYMTDAEVSGYRCAMYTDMLDEVDLGNTDAECPWAEPAHNLSSSGSPIGINRNESYRGLDTSGNAYMQFVMRNSQADATNLSLRFRVNNDDGAETDNLNKGKFVVVVNGDTLCTTRVMVTAANVGANGFYELEIPLDGMAFVGGNAKSEFVVRIVPSDTECPRLYWASLVKNGFDVSTAKHYDWNDLVTAGENVEELFYVGDYRRSDGVSYDNVNHTFSIIPKMDVTLHVTAKHDVCFGMDASKVTGKYYITPEERWYVVKGTGLQANRGKAHVWWFNGFNCASYDVTPDYVAEVNGEQIFAWSTEKQPTLTTNFVHFFHDGEERIYFREGHNYQWVCENHETIGCAGVDRQHRAIECVGLYAADKSVNPTITLVDYVNDEQLMILLGCEPYEFHAEDYAVADGTKASSCVVNATENTFAITGNNTFDIAVANSHNNISFGLKKGDYIKDNPGASTGCSNKYYVSRDRHWFVVKGEGLNIHARDYSYSYFVNGAITKAGGQTTLDNGKMRPTHVRKIGDEQVLAWDIAGKSIGKVATILAAVDESGLETEYIDCTNLTAASGSTATITGVYYMNDEEVENLFGEDVTDEKIVNPSFETGNYSPWVLSHNTSWNGVNPREGAANWSTDGSKIFGVWDAANDIEVKLSQSNISLPAGRYVLNVDMLASNTDGGVSRLGKQCVYASFGGETYKGYFRHDPDAEEVGSVNNESEVYNGDNVKLQMLQVEFEFLDPTTVEIGVATSDAENATWFKIDNFRLYRVEHTATMKVTKAARYATFCAPFDVVIPEGSGVVTYTATRPNHSEKALLKHAAGPGQTLPKHTPVIVFKKDFADDEGNYVHVFMGPSTIADRKTTPMVGNLIGTYVDISGLANTSTDNIYLLQNQSEYGVALYRAADDKAYKLGANRCYAIDSKEYPVKAWSFVFEEVVEDDVETTVDVPMGFESRQEIFDLQGRRVSKIRKGGIYIIGNKKVFVK